MHISHRDYHDDKENPFNGSTEPHFLKNAERVSYRLVWGDNYEGISVREVYYDKKNEIVGWGELPLTAITSSTKQLVKELIEAMHHIDNMFEATKKPILDEKALRKKLYLKTHGKK